MKRVKIVSDGGSYFSQPKSNLHFVPSGSKLLDLALGGGWARSRVSNIVGDKSSGKTLLCIEACANFAKILPKGNIRYRETESAFDPSYAKALGLPVDRVDFGGEPIDTTEALFKDLTKIAKGAKQEELVIVDSLDALSDDAEMEREFDKGTFGAQKAKNMSKMFRMLIRDLDKSKITLIIVSQIRDAIGVMYGKKQKRSGGHALDFYASQVVWLTYTGKISRTISGVKRVTGVKIKANIEKNKIALPYREADLKIVFGYGVDDLESCLSWLKESNNLRGLSIGDPKEHLRKMDDMDNAAFKAEVERIHEYVEKTWYSVEQKFLPERRKY